VHRERVAVGGHVPGLLVGCGVARGLRGVRFPSRGDLDGQPAVPGDAVVHLQRPQMTQGGGVLVLALDETSGRAQPSDLEEHIRLAMD